MSATAPASAGRGHIDDHLLASPCALLLGPLRRDRPDGCHDCGVFDARPIGEARAETMGALHVMARCLQHDAVAVEVSGAFRAAGVRSVLLKGAAVATWLYDDGALRGYGDADLLVSPADFERAEAVLKAAGFRLVRPGMSPLEETDHARAWARHGAVVDLHYTIWGVAVEPSRAWDVLTRDAVELRLGGGRLEALGIPARTLHVALHAAQHGGGAGKPLADLSRAAARVPLETWRDAAELARELGAEGAMAAGLGLHAATAPLAVELELPERSPLKVALQAAGGPLCAGGLMRVVEAPGLKGKLAMAARRVVPSPARMRARYPYANRGTGPLLVAYARRWLMLVAAAPSALRAISRARQCR
ncbi:MAG: nucleotidyltransferase family protein [Acidimicrobiales bacterium]